VVNEVYKRLELPGADPAVWLHVFSQTETLDRARKLLKTYPDPTARHPLFGIPFSIKDSIDIKGLRTTAACPEYAYIAEKDAPSYATLIEAGCIPIGKVNLVKPIFRSRFKLSNPFLFFHVKGPIGDWTCWDEIPIWPTGVGILPRLRLGWFLFRLVRISCLQSSLVLVGH
jgi:hypothetical protein